MRINLQAIDRSSPEPLHQQLANLLRGAISAGVYKPGERVESEKQFIEEGGLSYTPVARAFQTLVAEGWVVRRPGSGTFVASRHPEAAHPVLASIGCFYYKTDTPYFEALFAGIRDECDLHGIEAITIESGLEDDSEAQALHELEQHGVEGIIGLPLAQPHMQAELRRLVERQMPVVTIEVQMPNICCDTITFNYERGGHEAAQHLLDLNHQRIAMVGAAHRYPNTMNFKILAGIRRAHERRGLQYDEHLVHYLPLSFNEEKDVHLRHALIDHVRELRPTAIICTSNGMARYVIDTLHMADLRVPEDLSITGFSDAPVMRQFDSALTTVSMPLERAGTEAVRRLLVQATSTRRYPMQVMLDTTLVVGRSTSVAPSRLRQTPAPLRMPRPQP